MPSVIRWGRSAYETDAALARERADAESLGHTWTLVTDRVNVPAEQADALVVTSKVRVDAGVIARLRGSLVLTTTSGYEHIDVAAARARGVHVLRSPLARRDPVVEHALGSLITLMRRFPALDDAARAGHWARGDLPGLAPRGLRGARVGVVGLGVIGTRMAEVLAALGAEPVGADPAVNAVALRDIVGDLDAVTLHCSSTPSSRGLVSAGLLARLPPHAVVVNTARGEVLDVEAAVAAVRTRRLAGLAVDVFPVEPYPRLAEAAAVPGVLVHPHGSGYVHGLGDRVATEVRAALAAWTAGRPLPNEVS